MHMEFKVVNHVYIYKRIVMCTKCKFSVNAGFHLGGGGGAGVGGAFAPPCQNLAPPWELGCPKKFNS